jgi:hypothetical protein
LSTPARTNHTPKRLAENWRKKPQWWREFLYLAIFYGLYTAVRNINGSVLDEAVAKRHAMDIVQLERDLHIFNEHQIQSFFLDHTWAVRALDVWYGSAHFVVTVGVLFWLFHVQKQRYHKWRNVLLGTTFFALCGYLLYPLAPPRLLPESFRFVDTLQTVGGLWDFNSKTVENVSNQYAAMPSLHTGWAVWCALAIIPILKHWWTRAAIIVYPATTITAIVATANHYWADVAGGIFVFGLGYVFAVMVERWERQRALRRDAEQSQQIHGEAAPTTEAAT